MLSLLAVAFLAQAPASAESEWATPPPSRPAAPPPRLAPAAPSPVKISEQAKADYRRALELITRGDHTGATEILNKLGVENPKWAAVFAARCTAQVGLQYFQNALEDCNYALSLDPTGASPVWWLAEAEAGLNHREDAARHYRQYAASSASEVTPANRERAERRAVALDSPAPRPSAPPVAERPAPPPAPAPPVVIVVPAPYGSRAAPQYQTTVPDCRFSSDCGEGMDYSCRAWRGHQVYMGHGGPGAPCWFSSDCLSGSCDGSSKACR